MVEEFRNRGQQAYAIQNQDQEKFTATENNGGQVIKYQRIWKEDGNKVLKWLINSERWSRFVAFNGLLLLLFIRVSIYSGGIDSELSVETLT